MTGIDVRGKWKVRVSGIHKVFSGRDPTKLLTSKHLCERILLNPNARGGMKCRNYAQGIKTQRAWVVQE